MTNDITYPKAVLPNRMEISCVWDWEAEKLVQGSYRHVQDYFGNGITLGRGDTVFDLGANIGLFMLSAYDRCHGDVNVFAFEPIPVVYRVLRENANAFDPVRLRTFQCGVSSECTRMTFAYYPRATGFGTAYPDLQQHEIIEPMIFAVDKDFEQGNIDKYPIHIQASAANTPTKTLSDLEQKRFRKIQTVMGFKNAFKPEPVECEVVTLSHVIREHDIKTIHLLKMHVEKSELDVFAGIEENDWHKIQQIVVQIEGESQLLAVVEVLKSRGYANIVTNRENYFEGVDSYLLFARR